MEEYNISGKRIPFEWKLLLSIFNSSIKEMSITHFLSGALALGCALISCIGGEHNVPMQPYCKLAALFYIVSWIFFIVFRYYFAPSTWPFFMRIVVGTLYGLILIFLVICFYTISMEDLIWTGFWASASVWILIIDFPEIIYFFYGGRL